MRRWSTREWAPRFRFRRLGVAAPTSSSDPVRRARADRFVGGHGGYDLLIFDLVIPTLGRHSLVTLLDTLGSCDGPRPARILVVDDRRDRTVPLELGPTVEVLDGPGKGPAAARNVGWRAGSEPWVVFLDDDVVPTATWLTDLAEDLATAPLDVVAVQGRVTVPLPSDRRPTDWERSVTGLETARWITADMAVRRGALVNVDGFDERFSRAYREDADLALRLQAGSERLSVGRRRVLHPIPPAPWWVSLRLQAGHRDDVLMSALHGRDWRGQGAPPGRRRRHLATTASGLAGLTGAAFRRPVLARAGLAGWLAGTAELTCARVARGPRTPAEVAAMVGTSLLLPPLATWHWLAGLLGRRRLLARPGPQAPVDEAARARPSGGPSSRPA